MKPWVHAENSAKKFGGRPEDYLAIHDFFDSSKAHVPDMRHRALFHSSFGIYVAERVFGTWITNKAGVKVQVRDIGEQHVLEDLGTIPTLQDYFKGLPVAAWMGGPTKKITRIPLVD